MHRVEYYTPGFADFGVALYLSDDGIASANHRDINLLPPSDGADFPSGVGGIKGAIGLSSLLFGKFSQTAILGFLRDMYR